MVQNHFNLFYFLFIAVTALLGASGVWAVGELAKRSPDTVNGTFFAYFSVGTLAFVVGIGAAAYGVVDDTGAPTGAAGGWFMSALDFMLDIRAAMAVVGAAALLFVFPQVGSYVCSGLAGCAVAPAYVPQSLRLGVWIVVKAIVSASSVFMAFALLGPIEGWRGFDWSTSFQIVMTAVCLLSIAFLLIKGVSDSHLFSSALRRDRAYVSLLGVHRWFVRRRIPAEPGRSATDQALAEPPPRLEAK